MKKMLKRMSYSFFHRLGFIYFSTTPYIVWSDRIFEILKVILKLSRHSSHACENKKKRKLKDGEDEKGDLKFNGRASCLEIIYFSYSTIVLLIY